MSANHNAVAPKLHATTRACRDGQWPAEVSGLEVASARWTQGQAPHRTGFIAWGEAVRIETIGPRRFGEARERLAEIVAAGHVDDDMRRPGSGIVAFGAFAFDDSSQMRSFLIIPKYIHAVDGTTAWNTTIEAVWPAGFAEATHTTTGDAVAGSPVARKGAALSGAPASEAPRMTPERWLEKVETAIQRIRNHELDKVVLARAVDITMADAIDEAALADSLSSDYPLCWTYVMEGLVGATPEMLVQVRNRNVMSRVLAGTISRMGPGSSSTGARASDSERASALTGSKKDLLEHELAVHSVADALRDKGIAIEVPELPFVLELPNVMHLATDLHGHLPPGTTALDLAEALHPSAAVCGTPTSAAFEAIAELEELDRGLYSGPVGWVDGAGNGEWGIALRSGTIDRHDPHQITLYAGCGIMADSTPGDELAETEAKLIPMREALGLHYQSP